MARFRSKLTARVLPVVFVGFAVSTGVAVQSSASAQQAAVADKGRDITLTASGVVDTQARSAQQAAITLAGAANGFTGTDRSILVAEVREVARVTTGVSNVYLVYEKNGAPGGPDSRWRGRPGMTETGRVFAAYLHEPGREPTSVPYDEKAMEEAVTYETYTGPKKTGRLTTSEPYVDPGTNVLMTSFTYPLTGPGGKFAGMAGVDLPLGDLSKRIGATQVGRTGYAMLLSAKGTLLAAPPTKLDLSGVIGYKSLAQAASHNTKTAAELTERSRDVADGSLTARDPFGSGKALITWTRVPSTGWTLMTVIPTAEVRAPVVALQIKLVLTGLAVLLTVTVALVLAAAHLMRRLPRVRDAALQIAGGRLDVEIPAGDNDELGQVSAAFGAIVAYLRGANETHNRFAQMQALADADALTGVPNRRRFFELGDASVARTADVEDPSGQLPTTVLMIDIDHFKSINDTHGHPTGDDVIVAVSHRLADGLRAGDVIGRYGGEEFAVVLPRIDLNGVVAERLCAAVADRPMVTRSGPLHVSVSIGKATVEPADTGIGEALARADTALYRAKQAGRNRVA